MNCESLDVALLFWLHAIKMGLKLYWVYCAASEFHQMYQLKKSLDADTFKSEIKHHRLMGYAFLVLIYII